MGGPPDRVGNFDKSMGSVSKVPSGVVYFSGLQQVADPAGAGVTPLQSTQGAFSNKAITDANGNLLLVNPAPGTIGNMGLKWITGPSNLGLDMNLIKHFRLAENKDFEFRLDAVNVLNHANFMNPTSANLDINSQNFGRITTAMGSRTFVINARVNF
jgi:hypothetical protein